MARTGGRLKSLVLNCYCFKPERNVVASLHEEIVPGKAFSEGSIDSVEGRLLCWKHDGTVAWSRLHALTDNG